MPDAKALAALVLALAVVGACGDPAPRQEPAGDTAASSPGPAGARGDEAVREAGAGEPGEPAVSEAAGTPAMEGGVAVEAGFQERDGRVSLRVSLAGGGGGERYPAHVHEGRCADGGPVRLPLGRITVREDGTGSIRMTIDRDRLPVGPLFVQVLGAGGSPAACAELSGPESVPGPGGPESP